MTESINNRFIGLHSVEIIGSCDDRERETCQRRIQDENEEYKDIIQADFIDSYMNASLKTTTGYKWLVKNCPDSEFAFFADDDFYVSMKNLLSFLDNPLSDEYNKMPDGYIPFDGRLYVGWVASGYKPDRIHWHKFYLSLEDYPFDHLPDFVAGGAYILSNRAFKEIEAAMPFVKQFPFEDTYLGMIAKKLGIKLMHNKRFINDDRIYNSNNFQHVIAFHGSGDYELTTRIWREQMVRGNA